MPYARRTGIQTSADFLEVVPTWQGHLAANEPLAEQAEASAASVAALAGQPDTNCAWHLLEACCR